MRPGEDERLSLFLVRGDAKMQPRRLGASLLGAVLAGASIAFPALAASNYTLGDYPKPFVTDGSTNFLIVVGANAKPIDVVGAIDIAARLGAEPGEEKTITVSGTAGGQVSVSGEGVTLDTADSKLYLGDEIDEVVDTLTSKELPTILEKGTFEDDDGNTYDYNQYIEIGASKITFVQEDDDEDPVIAVQMGTSSSGDLLYTAKVSFSKALNCTDEDVKGNTIKLFGTEFTIAGETTSSELVLYKASTEVDLDTTANTEKTVTIGDKTYTIKLVGFDTDNDAVIIDVNGETKDIAEGASKKVGGLQVYAKSVTAWSQGAEGYAKLLIGSEKIILKNGDYVRVGDDEDKVKGTWVVVNDGSGDFSQLSTLEIKVYAPGSSDEDKYLAVGEEYTDPFAGTFKVKVVGISDDLKSDARDKIEFRVSGDNKGYVTLKDANGNEADVYFAYASGNSVDLQDDDQNDIFLVENSTVELDEITFLAPGDERYTHMVRVKDVNVDDTEGYVEFEDVISGDTYKTEEGEFNTTGDTLDLIVDGKTYTVTLVDEDAEEVAVAYNADSKVVIYPAIKLNNGETLAFVQELNLTSSKIPNGTTIVLPTGELNVSTLVDNQTTWNTTEVGQVTYDYKTDEGGNLTAIRVNGTTTNPAVLIVEEEDDDNEENVVVITTSADSGNLDYDLAYFTASSSKTWKDVSTSDDDVTANLDYYGTYVEVDTSDDDHTLVTVYYPDNQVYVNIAVMATGASVSTTEATEGQTITYESVVPIKSDIAALDSDSAVSAAKTEKNLILVGGPAVNKLVTEIFQKEYNLTPSEDGYIYGYQLAQVGICGTNGEYDGNQGLIKLVNDAFAEGKVALIVMGCDTEGKWTKAAARVLQQYDDYKEQLAGKTEVKLTGSVENPTIS